jgi:hypothetical protein
LFFIIADNRLHKDLPVMLGILRAEADWGKPENRGNALIYVLFNIV